MAIYRLEFHVLNLAWWGRWFKSSRTCQQFREHRTAMLFCFDKWPLV
jgi:hypothetical protein